MIVDLASPWCAAVEAGPQQQHLRSAFHDRHRTILQAVAQQRAIAVDEILPHDLPILRRVAARTSDHALRQRISSLTAGAAAAGFVTGAQLVLLPSDHDRVVCEIFPVAAPWLALFVTPSSDDTALLVALARGFALLTRWGAEDSLSVLTTTQRSSWDRWELARRVPLSEWIYSEGIGIHLAALLLPETSPAERIGTSPVAFTRLRERERALMGLLEHDLDEAGLGLHLRWLAADAAAGARRVGATVIPAGAGLYLAGRMVAERVRRIGLAQAAKADSRKS